MGVQPKKKSQQLKLFSKQLFEELFGQKEFF